MIALKAKIGKIEIDIETPANRKFWRRVGEGVRDVIHTRTYDRGEDADRHTFKPYSKAYEAKKRKAGLPSFKPNMSFSGRMLTAMKRGIRPRLRGNGVRLILSGEEGGKAYINEKRGREFFAMSDKNRVTIIKMVDRELVRLNGLK